jgi:DNA-directed RNA polymerase
MFHSSRNCSSPSIQKKRNKSEIIVEKNPESSSGELFVVIANLFYLVIADLFRNLKKKKTLNQVQGDNMGYPESSSG